KFKTTAQMISIILLILVGVDSKIYDLGMILLYIAASLTLWSMVLYLRAAWPSLTSPDRSLNSGDRQ
ncbi:MAG: CDP-diacylglycerol--glycerol-3-phosphate 3-phosphatidyltransferase, partial [Anaerolineae bacterium]